MLSPIIGVIGGMGPLATADFYRKLIEVTPAVRDQDHLHVIIDADPGIPDRTAALRGEGPSPLPRLAAAANRLESVGAGVLVIPCNTAHAFLHDLRERTRLPILDMIGEAALAAAQEAPSEGRVGVLATAGTVMTGLYDRALARHGLTTIYPDEADQRLVSEGIQAVKAGTLDEACEAFAAVAARVTAAGAHLLIAGCTEIPVVLDQRATSVPLIDPTRVLAEAAVRWARERQPEPAGSLSG